LGPVAFYK